MLEVILPCPHCRTDRYLSVQSFKALKITLFRVICNGCGVSGPAGDTRKSAIEAHNTIPRALTWTHEPPKVAGWYWRKETAADRAHVFHFTGNWEDYGEHWESDRVCQLPLNLNGNLWAGPISQPID